jgi:outer membrane cobalamin receptor
LARGARAPQISDAYSLQINQAAGAIKSETLDAAEVGLKGLVGPITVEAALFAMRKDNFFFRNANGFNVVNGKTNHKGVEISFDAPVNPYISVSGGFTLADHRYGFTDSVRSPSSSIRKGDQVDSAPHTLGYLQLKIRPADGLELALKGQHVGAYVTDPGNTARYPGHDVFTVSGRYILTPHISLYGRIDNVLDTAYADRADFAFGNERYFPARPRTLFLGIRYQD